MALHYLPPATRGWETRAHLCSAITNDGIAALWQVVKKFVDITKENRVFEERRRFQAREWMRSMVEEYLRALFYKHPEIESKLPAIENAVMAGKIPATTAAQQMVDMFEAVFRGEK